MTTTGVAALAKVPVSSPVVCYHDWVMGDWFDKGNRHHRRKMAAKRRNHLLASGGA